MGPSTTDTRIGIVSSSGVLRVTVPPKQAWLLILLEIIVISVGVKWIYGLWASMSLLLHVLTFLGLVSSALGLFYQLFVTQIIEFDPQRITICKEIRGWERKKEYRVEDCGELEWSKGAEGEREALKCRVGGRTIKVCEDVSEPESIQILTALQRSLPDVAQKICSYPRSKEHFVTLGLGKQG